MVGNIYLQVAKCIIPEPSDYLISHLFGDISIVDREKYPLNFCEKPLQMFSFSCKTKLDSMPCAVSGLSNNTEHINDHLIWPRFVSGITTCGTCVAIWSLVQR